MEYNEDELKRLKKEIAELKAANKKKEENAQFKDPPKEKKAHRQVVYPPTNPFAAFFNSGEWSKSASKYFNT